MCVYVCVLNVPTGLTPSIFVLSVCKGLREVKDLSATVSDQSSGIAFLHTQLFLQRKPEP